MCDGRRGRVCVLRRYGAKTQTAAKVSEEARAAAVWSMIWRGLQAPRTMHETMPTPGLGIRIDIGMDMVQNMKRKKIILFRLIVKANWPLLGRSPARRLSPSRAPDTPRPLTRAWGRTP